MKRVYRNFPPKKCELTSRIKGSLRNLENIMVSHRRSMLSWESQREKQREGMVLLQIPPLEEYATKLEVFTHSLIRVLDRVTQAF